MKATYHDFLTANPNCSSYEYNQDAAAVFSYLSQDEMIIRMIEFSDMGKPALAACAADLEAFVDQLPLPQIDLTDGFTRTVVGRMVKSILDPFGYRPTVQKSFPKAYSSKYFTSASCYSLSGPATMKVVKAIAEV